MADESHLLKKSTVQSHVLYDFTEINYQNAVYNGCQCADFLQDGQEIITLEKLFRLEWGIDLTHTLAPMELKERILFVVERVSELTGLEGFGAYLRCFRIARVRSTEQFVYHRAAKYLLTLVS